MWMEWPIFIWPLKSVKVYVLLLDALEYAHKMQFFEKDGRRYGAVGPFLCGLNKALL